jgi:hypothetical protein
MFNITLNSQNLSIVFKDVKLWTTSLDPHTLYYGRFKQTMADLPDLALNYKLMHGNSIIDEVS